MSLASYRLLYPAAELRAPPDSGADGAGGGTRTRNIQFGRLALYQLSYAREIYRMLKSTPTC